MARYLVLVRGTVVRLMLVLVAFVCGLAIAAPGGAGGASEQLHEEMTLTPPGGNPGSDYWPVAVSGSTLVVGYPNFGQPGYGGTGTVYVFSRVSSTSPVGWREVATLVASDARSGGWFPYALAVSGNVVVVGELTGFSASGRDGEVDVFTRPSGGWSGTVSPSARLMGPSGTAFGASVAVSGRTIFASAPDATVSSHPDEGAVFAFTEPRRGWSGRLRPDARLIASVGSDAQLGDAPSLAASGSDVFAGAYRSSVRVFHRPPGGWHGTVRETARLVSMGPTYDPHLAADGATVVVGTPALRASSPAVSYIFSRPAHGWPRKSRPAAWFSFNTDHSGATPDVAISGRVVAAVEQSGYPGHGCSPCSGMTFVLHEPLRGWAHHTYPLIKPAASFRTSGWWDVLALDPDELFGGGIDGVYVYSYSGA